MSRIAPIVLAWVGFAALAAPARAQFVDGDLYVGSWLSTIYRVDPATWTVTTFADSSDGLVDVSALEFTPDGTTLLSSDYGAASVFAFDSSGNGTVLHDKNDGLKGPFGENGLAFDASGNLYVSDFVARSIFFFPAGGGAGSVFADTSDGIGNPDGLAFTAIGELLVANRGMQNVLTIDAQGNATVFDTLPDDPFTIVIRDDGDVYVGTYSSPERIYKYVGGDPAQRTVFASFSNNQGNPVLQFSRDQTKLYFTSYGTGNLIEVDADTAAWTEVIPPGGLPGANGIAIAGSHHTATSSNYGTGVAGTNGVPSFTSQQVPALGASLTLDVANSNAQPTSGLFFLGFQQANLHTGLGGDLLLIPALVLPITFSYGGDSFTGAIPNDPALFGFEIDLQAVEADPGAVKGFSFTQGLELVLGS
jgi:sugar lactone lactonase YvrE